MNTQTQSIIVYRNPLEKAMWESDAGAWLALGLLAVLLCVLVGSGIASAYEAWRRRR